MTDTRDVRALAIMEARALSAEKVADHAQEQHANWQKRAQTAEAAFLAADTRATEAERERDKLRGIAPEFPPRPPNGEGVPRYGLRWNGPELPLAVPMDDGYWTPAHLAEQRIAELERENAAQAEWLDNAKEENAELTAERDAAWANLRKTNANMEEAERDLYLRLGKQEQEAEQRIAELTSALAAHAVQCPQCQDAALDAALSGKTEPGR